MKKLNKVAKNAYKNIIQYVKKFVQSKLVLAVRNRLRFLADFLISKLRRTASHSHKTNKFALDKFKLYYEDIVPDFYLIYKHRKAYEKKKAKDFIRSLAHLLFR